MSPLRPARVFAFETARLSGKPPLQKVGIKATRGGPGVEPAAVLRLPEAGDRFAGTQDEIHGVAVFEPAVRALQSALREALEHRFLVIQRIKRLHGMGWLGPQLANPTRLFQIGDAAVLLEQHAAQVDVEIVPAAVVENLGDAVVVLLHPYDARIGESGVGVDAVQRGAEQTAVPVAVDVEQHDQVALVVEDIFGAGIRIFVRALHREKAGFPVGYVTPDGNRLFGGRQVAPFRKIDEPTHIAVVGQQVGGHPGRVHAHSTSILPRTPSRTWRRRSRVDRPPGCCDRGS